MQYKADFAFRCFGVQNVLPGNGNKKFEYRLVWKKDRLRRGHSKWAGVLSVEALKRMAEKRGLKDPDGLPATNMVRWDVVDSKPRHHLKRKLVWPEHTGRFEPCLLTIRLQKRTRKTAKRNRQNCNALEKSLLRVRNLCGRPRTIAQGTLPLHNLFSQKEIVMSLPMIDTAHPQHGPREHPRMKNDNEDDEWMICSCSSSPSLSEQEGNDEEGENVPLKRDYVVWIGIMGTSAVRKPKAQ